MVYMVADLHEEPLDWENVIGPFRQGFGHEGKLSQQRYKIKLSSEYEKLYQEALCSNRSVASHLGEMSMEEFPLIVSRLNEFSLNNASGADIGILISYFSYRNQTLEQITDGMQWNRV